jgi:hypothetical protein
MEQVDNTSSILIDEIEDLLSVSNDSSANNNYIIDYGKMTVDQLKAILELPDLFDLVSTNAEDKVQICTPPPLPQKPETPKCKPVVIKFAKRPLHAKQAPHPTDVTPRHPRKANRKRSSSDHDRQNDKPSKKRSALPPSKNKKISIYDLRSEKC